MCFVNCIVYPNNMNVNLIIRRVAVKRLVKRWLHLDREKSAGPSNALMIANKNGNIKQITAF